MSQEASPFDMDAEKHTLGAMLQDRNACDLAIGVLGEQTTVFYKAANQFIYGAILRLIGKNAPVDLFTVTTDLKTHGELARVGSTEYLYDMQEGTPAAANVAFYAGIVKEKAIRRALIQAGNETVNRAGRDELDLDDVIEDAQRLLTEVSQRANAKTILWASDLFEPALEEVRLLRNEGRELRGHSSGFPDLDRRINGLCPGRLHILGARSKEGKSTLAQNIAVHVAAKEGKPVLFVTLEMPPSEVARRILASKSRIDGVNLDSGRVNAEGWTRLTEDTDWLSRIPFGMLTEGTPAGIRAGVLAAKAKYGELGLLVVDYLQLMRGAKRTANRENEVAEYSRFLKELAMEQNIPVFALAQLRREVDSRGDRKPTAADLRESGAMEQDADVVLLIWRNNRAESDEEKVSVIVERARNGRPGDVDLDWHKPYFLFRGGGEMGTDFVKF